MSCIINSEGVDKPKRCPFAQKVKYYTDSEGKIKLDFFSYDNSVEKQGELFVVEDIDEEKTLFSNKLVVSRRMVRENYEYQGVMHLPCKRCIYCVKSRRSVWALRAELEAGYHFESSFWTLTYDRRHIPENGELRKEDYQKFFKRLRTYLYRKVDKNIKLKYMIAGEYGGKKGRCHFHFILFGWKPPDLILYNKLRYSIYVSDIAEKLWGNGYVKIGVTVNAETAGYILKYIKKFDSTKWNYLHSQKEFFHVSKGIGRQYLLDNYNEIYKNGFIYQVIKGKIFRKPIPVYFNYLVEKLSIFSDVEIEEMKQARIRSMKENAPTNAEQCDEIRRYFRYCESQGIDTMHLYNEFTILLKLGVTPDVRGLVELKKIFRDSSVAQKLFDRFRKNLVGWVSDIENRYHSYVRKFARDDFEVKQIFGDLYNSELDDTDTFNLFLDVRTNYIGAREYNERIKKSLSI